MSAAPLPTDKVSAEFDVPLGAGSAPCQKLDSLSLTDCVDWLSFHRLWGRLSEPALYALAKALCRFRVEANIVVYHQGQAVAGLYLVKWGTVELFRQSSVGRIHIVYRNAGDTFGYIPWVEGQSASTYDAGALTLSPGDIWFLPQVACTELAHHYPELQGILNQLLTQDLAELAQRVSWEETRIQGLQPYIHPVPTDEVVVGQSKIGRKLAQHIAAAATDLKPVLLQAPAGAGKTFVAGSIHRQSGATDRPFAEVDCAQLPREPADQQQTAVLFGSQGKPGLLQLLERGTLLLENVQMLNPEAMDLLRQYLKTGSFTHHGQPVKVWVRLILASPKSLALPDIDHHTIKLPTLSQRKRDIPAFAQHFLDRFCREQGRPFLTLNQADLRRLISYSYPGDLHELAGILERAVLMTPPGQTVMPEQVLWSVQSDKNAFRIDLLNHVPWLRRFLLSRWWPQGVWWPMMALFIPVVVMGYIGPQGRDDSFTLNFFWAWWWPAYLFYFAFVGRVWCAVCPFMITAEWLRKLSLWIWPREQLPWPNQWMNRWGAWLLFGGFLAIYLWEKLWDLPHRAYLSASLLLVITAGAVIFSLIYERRLWCRYLCPIGGMNGMFAKLSMVELRATQQVCGSQCSTFGCYKGSDATPVLFADALPTEGQATGGCPLYSHPAQLQDNRDCMLCMTCVKACPNRSGQLNLRFPATDLLEHHRGFWAEVALLLLLLGGVCMHESPTILAWLGVPDLPIDADHFWISLPVALGLLSIPTVLTLGLHQIARLMDREMPGYLTVIYAYLPLTLAANLTHYIPAAMTEAGKILPVTARTFGLSAAWLPTLTWSLEVATFLQGVTLLSVLAFSVYPLLRITQRPFWSNLPHLIGIFGLTAFFWKLMV
jgi:transcriptional regulator with AAA-type ATPase domain/NAD-dependent dihydropyrimidine dehydrogenase PreA subunit